jgi:hypothetical protein
VTSAVAPHSAAMPASTRYRPRSVSDSRSASAATPSRMTKKHSARSEPGASSVIARHGSVPTSAAPSSRSPAPVAPSASSQPAGSGTSWSAVRTSGTASSAMSGDRRSSARRDQAIGTSAPATRIATAACVSRRAPPTASTAVATARRPITAAIHSLRRIVTRRVRARRPRRRA